MRYSYPCNLVSYESQGEGFVVTFPDFPEAITGGNTKEESLFLAQDVLVSALLAYVKNGWDTPAPSTMDEGQCLIALPPVVGAKIALYSAMREQGISKLDSADKLGISEKAAGNLVNPDYGSHMTSVMNALKAVGLTLIIEVRSV